MKRENWVIIAVLVAGWIIVLGQPTIFSTNLRGLVANFVTPFVKLGDLIPVLQSRRELFTENTKLRAENARLRDQVNALAEAGREKMRLEELLSLKPRIAGRTVGARVIGRDASNWWKTIQLDRGTRDGLRENLTVLNSDGLVGKIVTATKGEARVLLLADPGCKVSAVLQDTREPGIVAGSDNALASDPRCLMTFVNRNARIRTGESVITSGLGGVFPKGIVVGTVAGAQLNPQTGMYQDIEIKPAVDFRRLEEVIVILE